MKLLKHSIKSCVQICSPFASAQALPTAIRKPTKANYVNRANAGLKSLKILIKKARIHRGIKTARVHNGVKIPGKWQNTSCLLLDQTSVL